MAKNTNRIWILCIVLNLFYFNTNFCIAQKVIENYPVLQQTTELRKKLITLEQSFIGIKEKTGNNDGPEIKKFLAYVGLPERNPWCAAGQSYCHGQLNIPNPESGYSPDWFKQNVVYEKNGKRLTPYKFRGGEVTGYWIPYKGRIGHVGMAERQDGRDVITIEFNYMNRVMRVMRSFSEIYIVADYVGYKELYEALKKKKK